jgi:hypothetical protein
MKRIIDYKQVDITEEEYAYLQQLLAEPPADKDQMRGLFEVDADGCITAIKPPIRGQVAWGLLIFFQNLMINQRLGRMERRQQEALRSIEERMGAALKTLYDLVKEEKDGRKDDNV